MMVEEKAAVRAQAVTQISARHSAMVWRRRRVLTLSIASSNNHLVSDVLITDVFNESSHNMM
jgi:hypothetical protein